MKYLVCGVLLVISELVAALVFWYLREKLGPQKKGSPVFSITKGILERLVLFCGLMTGVQQVIAAYGAIKIGTRLKSQEEITNDYFLVGNMVSIFFAITTAHIAKTVIATAFWEKMCSC